MAPFGFEFIGDGGGLVLAGWWYLGGSEAVVYGLSLGTLLASAKAINSLRKGDEVLVGLEQVLKHGDDLASFIGRAEGNIPGFYATVVKAGLKTEKAGDIIIVYAKNGKDVLAEISGASVRFIPAGLRPM